MLRALLLVVGLSFLGVAAAIALVPVPSHAAEPPIVPCPPGVAGRLTNISRPITPIGASAVRTFTVPGHSVTGMRLSAPAEYKPQQLPAQNGFRLRFTAPRAGPFAVKGDWTEAYDSGTCAATDSSTLTAAQGSRVIVKSPPTEFNGRQYDNPAVWSWKCAEDTDPTPLDLTIRWEVGRRLIAGRNQVGKPPYTFSRRAKTISARAGDSCDEGQQGTVHKTLAKNARLKIVVGNGGLLVQFGGEFRTAGSRGSLLPLHLGVTMKQGSRTLVNSKICAWQQTGYEIAKRKDVGCWY